MKKNIVIIILFLSCIAKGQTTRYVDGVNGDNGSPGTFANPYKTITYGISEIIGGDTLYVMTGTYNERVSLSGKSGTTSKRTHIAAYEGESPIVDGTGIVIPAGGGLVHINSSYLDFTGFEVKEVNMNAEGSGESGIVTRFSNCLISNNVVHNIWGPAIVNIADYCVIEYNYTYNVGMQNENGQLGKWPAAITSRNATEIAKHVIIRHNKVHDSWGEGISFHASEYGIMEDNEVYDTYSVAMYIRNSQYCLMQRNLIYQVKNMSTIGRGIAHWNEAGMEWFTNLDNTIINNIVIGCDRNIHFSSKTVGLIVANNTFVNSTWISNVHFSPNMNYESMIFKNNIVIQEGSLPCVDIDDIGHNVDFSNNLYNKAVWALAQGDNDIIGDPDFVETGSSFSAEYYQLGAASDAINTGIDIDIIEDYGRRLRDGSPDIGAWEYGFLPEPYFHIITAGGDLVVGDRQIVKIEQE